MSSNQPFRKFGGINRFKTHEFLNNDTIHTNCLTVNKKTTLYGSVTFDASGIFCDPVLFKECVGIGQETIADINCADFKLDVSGNTRIYGKLEQGNDTYASGNYSHAEGQNTEANGIYSHAEGSYTKANGYASHTEGLNADASGNYSHAEGTGTIANGFGSHAEGQQTIAEGDSSHVEGYKTTTSANYSHAEGNQTTTNGNYSHAEGNLTTTNGISSHAEGYETIAQGDYSHAEGLNTYAYNQNMHASGKFNIKNNIYYTFPNYVPVNTVIGAGTSDTDRKDALVVLGDSRILLNPDGDGGILGQSANVGIGTIDPDAILHINDTNDLSFNSTTDASNSIYNLLLEKKTTAEDISGTVGMKFVTEDGSGNKMGSSAIVLEPSGSSYAMNFYVKTGSDPIDTSDKVFGIENDAKMNIYAPMVIQPKNLTSFEYITYNTPIYFTFKDGSETKYIGLHYNHSYVGSGKTPLYIRDPSNLIPLTNTTTFVRSNTPVKLYCPARDKFIIGGRQGTTNMLKFSESGTHFNLVLKDQQSGDLNTTLQRDLLTNDTFVLSFTWDCAVGSYPCSSPESGEKTWYFKNEIDNDYDYALTTDISSNIVGVNAVNDYDGFKEYEPDVLLSNNFAESGNVSLKLAVHNVSNTQMGAGAIAIEPSGNSYAMNFYVKSGDEPMDGSDMVLTLENDKKIGINAPLYSKNSTNTIDVDGNLTINGTLTVKKQQIDTVIYNTVNIENSLLMTRFFEKQSEFGNEGGSNNIWGESIEGSLNYLLEGDISRNKFGPGSDIVPLATNKTVEVTKDISGTNYLFMTQDNIPNLTGKNDETKIEGAVNILRDIVSNSTSNGVHVPQENTSDVGTLKYSKIYIYLHTLENGDDEYDGEENRVDISASYYDGISDISFINLETGEPNILDSGNPNPPYSKLYGLYVKLDTPDTLDNILNNTRLGIRRIPSDEAHFYALTELYILFKGAADIFNITDTDFKIIAMDDTTNKIEDVVTVSHGENNEIKLNGSVQSGNLTQAKSAFSHAEGFKTIVDMSGNNPYNPHVENSYNTTGGDYAHAEGNETFAHGYASHAEGCGSTTMGNQSHAEGFATITHGECSHAEGYRTDASGNYSHAEGSFTNSNGISSHAEGHRTVTNGAYSHAEGNQTLAYNPYMHVSGQFNKSTNSYEGDNVNFLVGAGRSAVERKDAFVVLEDSRILLNPRGQDDTPYSANVGIGTIDPQATLDISGSFNVDNGSGGTYAGAEQRDNYPFRIGATRSWGSSILLDATALTGGEGWLMQSTGGLDNNVQHGADQGPGKFVITRLDAIDNGTKFTIDPFGNVGIGKNSPTATLDVSGNVNISGKTNTNELILHNYDSQPSGTLGKLAVIDDVLQYFNGATWVPITQQEIVIDDDIEQVGWVEDVTNNEILYNGGAVIIGYNKFEALSGVQAIHRTTPYGQIGGCGCGPVFSGGGGTTNEWGYDRSIMHFLQTNRPTINVKPLYEIVSHNGNNISFNDTVDDISSNFNENMVGAEIDDIFDYNIIGDTLLIKTFIVVFKIKNTADEASDDLCAFNIDLSGTSVDGTITKSDGVDPSFNDNIVNRNIPNATYYYDMNTYYVWKVDITNNVTFNDFISEVKIQIGRAYSAPGGFYLFEEMFFMYDLIPNPNFSNTTRLGIGTSDPSAKGHIVSDYTDSGATPFDNLRIESQNDISSNVVLRMTATKVAEDNNTETVGDGVIALEPSGNSYAMNFYVKTGDDVDRDTDTPQFSIENEGKMNINVPVDVNVNQQNGANTVINTNGGNIDMGGGSILNATISTVPGTINQFLGDTSGVFEEVISYTNGEDGVVTISGDVNIFKNIKPAILDASNNVGYYYTQNPEYLSYDSGTTTPEEVDNYVAFTITRQNLSANEPTIDSSYNMTQDTLVSLYNGIYTDISLSTPGEKANLNISTTPVLGFTYNGKQHYILQLYNVNISSSPPPSYPLNLTNVIIRFDSSYNQPISNPEMFKIYDTSDNGFNTNENDGGRYIRSFFVYNGILYMGTDNGTVVLKKLDNLALDSKSRKFIQLTNTMYNVNSPNMNDPYGGIDNPFLNTAHVRVYDDNAIGFFATEQIPARILVLKGLNAVFSWDEWDNINNTDINFVITSTAYVIVKETPAYPGDTYAYPLEIGEPSYTDGSANLVSKIKLGCIDSSNSFLYYVTENKSPTYPNVVNIISIKINEYTKDVNPSGSTTPLLEYNQQYVNIGNHHGNIRSVQIGPYNKYGYILSCTDDDTTYITRFTLRKPDDPHNTIPIYPFRLVKTVSSVPTNIPLPSILHNDTIYTSVGISNELFSDSIIKIPLIETTAYINDNWVLLNKDDNTVNTKTYPELKEYFTGVMIDKDNDIFYVPNIGGSNITDTNSGTYNPITGYQWNYSYIMYIGNKR